MDKASNFGSKGPEFKPHKKTGHFSKQKINSTLLLSTQVYKWVLRVSYAIMLQLPGAPYVSKIYSGYGTVIRYSNCTVGRLVSRLKVIFIF